MYFSNALTAVSNLERSLAVLSTNRHATVKQWKAVERAAREVYKMAYNPTIALAAVTARQLVEFDAVIKKVGVLSERLRGPNGSTQTKRSAKLAVEQARAALILRKKGWQESGFSECRFILNDVRFRDDDEAAQLPLFQKAKGALNDAHFRFLYMEALARSAPRFLLNHLDAFSLKEKQEILQIGSLFASALDRTLFAMYYKVSPQEIEKAHADRQKNLREESDTLLGQDGNCFGTTLAMMAQDTLFFDETTARKARFIQSAHRLSLRQSGDERVIGASILRTPLKFPETLSFVAKTFGYTSVQAMMDDYAVGNRTLEYKIGKEALKCQRLLDKMEDLKKQEEEIIDKIALLETQKKEQEARGDFCSDMGDLETALTFLQEALVIKEKIDSLNGELTALRVKAASLDSELTEIDALLNAHTVTLIPDLILRRMQLSKGEVLADQKVPLGQFMGTLEKWKRTKGEFELKLSGNSGNHAIYFSFEKLSFCDTNDYDLVTLTPHIRTFQTSEELIISLQMHLACTYDEYSHFSLSRYKKAAS